MTRVFLLMLSFFFCVAAGAQVRRLTLQQCIDTALQNNIELRRALLATDAASVRYRQSRDNLLPSVNGIVNHGVNRGRSIDPFTNTFVNQSINYSNYGLGASLPLFNGFSLRNEMKQFAYALSAAKLEAEQVKVDLTLDVMVAYLQVLNNEDLVAVARQQVEVTRKQIERLEALNRQGAIAPPQLHELRGQLKDNELSVLNGQNALATARLSLTQLMNVSYDPQLQLQRLELTEQPEEPRQSAAEVYQSALAGLPGLRATALRSQSAASAIRAGKGALFPSLSLNGNAGTTYSSIATRDVFLGSRDTASSSYVVVNGSQLPVFTKRGLYETQRIGYGSQLNDNFNYNIGLTLRIPILNSFQARNRIRLAEIDLRSAKLAEENTRLQLRQEVELAHLSLQNAWARFQLVQEQADAFREAFRAAEVRFNAGVGNSVDYVLAKNNYDRANLNQVVARYDYLLRRQVIGYYMTMGSSKP